MTEGQHSHDELRAELDALKTQLEQNAQQGDAVTQEATQAAVNAQQAAEVAVTESAVTRADLESLRDELKAAIAELNTQVPKEVESAPEGNSEPSNAIGTELTQPPALEEVIEGEPQEAPPVEPKETKNKPPRKRKSVWWG